MSTRNSDTARRNACATGAKTVRLSGQGGAERNPPVPSSPIDYKRVVRNLVCFVIFSRSRASGRPRQSLFQNSERVKCLRWAKRLVLARAGKKKPRVRPNMDEALECYRRSASPLFPDHRAWGRLCAWSVVSGRWYTGNTSYGAVRRSLDQGTLLRRSMAGSATRASGGSCCAKAEISSWREKALQADRVGKSEARAFDEESHLDQERQ